MKRIGRLSETSAFEVGPTQEKSMPRPTNSSSITLQIESAVVRRYVSVIRQLRHKPGIATPTVQELILRELSHRTAAGIVDDFLQSDWPAKNRRGGVRRVQKPR
jgi:hypothetical protein